MVEFEMAEMLAANGRSSVKACPAWLLCAVAAAACVRAASAALAKVYASVVALAPSATCIVPLAGLAEDASRSYTCRSLVGAMLNLVCPPSPPVVVVGPASMITGSWVLSSASQWQRRIFSLDDPGRRRNILPKAWAPPTPRPRSFRRGCRCSRRCWRCGR